MKFTELTIQDYESFATCQKGSYYLNSSKMIELKKKNGWDTYYVGIVVDNNTILAAAGFCAVPIARKYKYAYAPRGILCDFNNYELTSFFTQELKKYIAQNGMAYLRMDPYIEYQELDVNGHVVEGGWNNQAMIDFLQSLGYQHKGFTTGQNADSQTRYMVVLDLDGKNKEDIVAGFEPNTRRTILRTEKLGVKTKQLSPESLDEFMKLMDFTAQKRNFTDMGMEAYQNQMEAFGLENAKVVVSYLDTQGVHDKNKEDLKVIQKEMEETDRLLAENPRSKKMNRRKNEELERIKQIERLEKETSDLEAQYGKEIILSAAYFVIYDGEMYYISSGSYDQFRKYNGPYYIQYHAILEALDRGCHRYNFTGTSGIFDESADDYGVFEFKKRLGGRPIELLGEFELVCDLKIMKKIQRIQTLKKLIKR